MKILVACCLLIILSACEDKVAKASQAFAECHFATKQTFPREKMDVGWPPIAAPVLEFMDSCMASKGIAPNKDLPGCVGYDMALQRYCYPSELSEPR